MYANWIPEHLPTLTLHPVESHLNWQIKSKTKNPNGETKKRWLNSPRRKRCGWLWHCSRWFGCSWWFGCGRWFGGHGGWGCDYDSVHTGVYIPHLIHNHQLHCRWRAGCSVKHGGDVLVSRGQGGIQGAVALSEADAVHTCTVNPICNLEGQRPHGRVVAVRAVGL